MKHKLFFATPVMLVALLLIAVLSAPPHLSASSSAPSSALGWVGLMYPGAADGVQTGSSSLTVYIQVYKAGATDNGAPESGDISCAIHWSPVDGAGTWTSPQDTPMTFNAGFAPPAGSENNHEYIGTISGSGMAEYTVKCTDATDGEVYWQQDGNGAVDFGISVTPTPVTPTAVPATATPCPGGTCPTPTIAPTATPCPGGSCVPSFPARTAFVHLFEWKWTDIALECEDYLGPKGVGAIQVSPPMEHAIVTNAFATYPWYQRYQPVSYKIESRSGTRAEFADMVTRCAAVGVEIYVDAVINHMAGQDNGTTSTGSAGTTFTCDNIAGTNCVADYPTDPGQYSSNDFHLFSSPTCTKNIDQWNDWDDVQNCELLGLDDLNTSSSYVQNEIREYLNDLVSLGVKGFRIDAAKHMHPNDLNGIMNGVTGWPGDTYVFGEVIQDTAFTGSNYTFLGGVTEFDYFRNVAPNANNGNFASLSSVGNGLLSSNDAVVFIDNHDTQRSHADLTYKDGDSYTLANYFMLAHPYGYPKVMSSYYFNDDAQSPPTNGGGDTKSVWSGGSAAGCNSSDWVCEHRWGGIGNMFGFRNFTDGQPMTDWWDNGYDQIAFGRADKGFVVINSDNGALNQTFNTSMAAGDYCDIIDGDLLANGSCSGRVITVASDGTFSANVDAMDGLAIHVGAMTNSTTPVVTVTPSPTSAPVDPSVSFNSPADGDIVTGTFTVDVCATHPNGIDDVQFYLDGTLLTPPTQLRSAVKAPAAIVLDGEDTADEWNTSNLVSTDPAYDSAQAANGVHHERHVDFTAMYATWDATNLYVAIQSSDVVDVVDPANANSGDFVNTWSPSMAILIDTQTGGYSVGGDMWGISHEFAGDDLPDYQVYFAHNMWQGPFLQAYSGGAWSGSATQWNPGDGLDGAVSTTRAAGNYAGGPIVGPDGTDYVAGGHDVARSSLWEIQIPLTLIGNPDLNNSAVKLFVVHGDGSSVDSIPDDMGTVDTLGVSDSNSPLEWSDADTYTSDFACVGNGSCGTLPPPPPSGTCSYTMPIDTSIYTQGSHTIQAVANSSDATQADAEISVCFGSCTQSPLAVSVESTQTIDNSLTTLLPIVFAILAANCILLWLREDSDAG